MKANWPNLRLDKDFRDTYDLFEGKKKGCSAMRVQWFGIVLLALGVGLTFPQLSRGATVSVDQAECLPIEDNGLITLQATGEPAGSSVRVYFRRLHEEVEDFYYVVARPEGQGKYWSVLPKAENEILEEKNLVRDPGTNNEVSEDWANWWREKERSEDRDPNDDLNEELIRERASRGKQERRDWLQDIDDAMLQDWLKGLENEPTEYFATVHDATGQRIARSKMKVAEVRRECNTELTEQQLGEADNLTVGETAGWEDGERVFHWLCDGVVTRVDPDGILRNDEFCRACIIAWWKKKEVLIPSVLVPPAIVISSRPNPPISPAFP